MDVLHCHYRLCRGKSAVCKCRFVHFGLTGPLENCDGFSKWGERGWKTFVDDVTAKKLLSHRGSSHGLCETIPSKSRERGKGKCVGACLEWFYPCVCSSPWSQRCAPDEQTRLGTLTNNFGCWLSHLSLFREEILATRLCFPWCSIFAVCGSLVAAGVQQTSLWSYQFGDSYFFPSVTAFMTKWWFLVAGKVWALWNS